MAEKLIFWQINVLLLTDNECDTFNDMMGWHPPEFIRCVLSWQWKHC